MAGTPARNRNENPPPGGDRLKINLDWERAAEKLIHTPAKSTPPRAVKPRKKSKPKR